MKKMILFILVFFATSCRSPIPDRLACTQDSDCVPAQCCHPTDVVNEDFAPDCADAFCTRSCEGPIDCGRGKPVCDAGKCKIEPIVQ